MIYKFKLPEIGEGINDGQIVKLFIKPSEDRKEFARNLLIKHVENEVRSRKKIKLLT